MQEEEGERDACADCDTILDDLHAVERNAREDLRECERETLGGHGDKLSVHIKGDTDRNEYDADEQHRKLTEISRDAEIAKHPLRKVRKIAKKRRKHDLENMIPLELFAQQGDLQKDIGGKHADDAGTHLCPGNEADHIGQRVDGRNAQVGVDCKRDGKREKQKPQDVNQDTVDELTVRLHWNSSLIFCGRGASRFAARCLCTSGNHDDLAKAACNTVSCSLKDLGKFVLIGCGNLALLSPR